MNVQRSLRVDRCPQCGAHVFHRFGEYFPPMLADILDAIIDLTIRRGSVEMESLCVMFYGGVSLGAARNRMRVNINHINNLLASTDVRIVSKRLGNGKGREDIESGYKATGFTFEQIKSDRPWISYRPGRSRDIGPGALPDRDRGHRKAGLRAPKKVDR